MSSRYTIRLDDALGQACEVVAKNHGFKNLQKLILHLLELVAEPDSEILSGDGGLTLPPNDRVLTSNQPMPDPDVAVERMAAAFERALKTNSHRSTSKQDEISRRVAHMLAWVDQTGETEQQKVALEFGLTPSALRNEAYECVRRVVSLNKQAAKMRRMTSGVTYDCGVLNE